jgi:hypothetical protein
LNPNPTGFYVALEDVLPPVPEAALRPSLNTIKAFGDGESLQLAVKCGASSVARFALDALARRGIGLATLTNRPYAFCRKDLETTQDRNESAIFAAIAALKIFVQREDGSEVQRHKPGSPTTFVDLTIAPQGFRCDQPKALKDPASSDTLLQKAADSLTGSPSLSYAEAVLKEPGFQAKFPRFVVTNEAKSRLDEVCYSLRSGVPLLIQGPTSASKSVTTHVAAIGLFGDPPLVYALNEQTEVADLLGRKLLRRSGAALLSFVPAFFTQAYTEG